MAIDIRGTKNMGMQSRAPRRMAALLVMAVVFAASVRGRALAQQGTLYYYDGGERRNITLEEGMVAGFGESGKNAVKGLFPAAEAEAATARRGGGFAALFKVAPNALKTALKPSAGAPAFSPVFHEGEGKAGPLLALPGGVIVNFYEGWDDTQVRQWAEKGGYEVGEKLDIGGNHYLINTPPGQAALDTANSIQESGQVLSATPNWWREHARR